MLCQRLTNDVSELRLRHVHYVLCTTQDLQHGAAPRHLLLAASQGWQATAQIYRLVSAARRGRTGEGAGGKPAHQAAVGFTREECSLLPVMPVPLAISSRCGLVHRSGRL